MRRRTILIISLLAAIIALFTAGALWRWLSQSHVDPEPAGTAASVEMYRSGPFLIGATVDPATPVVGNNRLIVHLQDTEGEPVTGATFKAVATMPAMGTMPAMYAPVDLRETVLPGVYEGAFQLSMAGAWPLTLEVEKAGIGRTRISFDLATSRPGLSLSSGGQPVEGSDRAGATMDGAMEAQDEIFQSGPFRVSAAIDPETPVIGDNRLTVRLRDMEGDPVTNAEMEAVAVMPAMGTMPAMYAPVELEETAPGVYQGPYRLSMAGAWPLTLEVEKAGIGRTRISFDLATSQRGLTITSGGRPVDDTVDQGMRETERDMPVINLDTRRRQLIGVEIEEAARRDLSREINAVGEIIYDETRVWDISLRFDAWIGELYADYVGKVVEQGEPLFTVYSPEFLAAQQEYLEIYRRRQGLSNTLLSAVRQRLLLWGMTSGQIDALQERGEAFDYVPVLAPRNGTIVEKNIVAGSARKAGETLLRIADLSEVWVDAKVYENELPLVAAGMPARVVLPYLPGVVFETAVDFVYPYLQEATRTTRIRLSLPNPDGRVKPGMYAEVQLQADLGERLTVPESAVVFSGQERIVFVDLGGGRLQPRYVETGQRNENYIEVTAGLEPGEAVVTSGNFLIDAETRLKTGIKQW